LAATASPAFAKASVGQPTPLHATVEGGLPTEAAQPRVRPASPRGYAGHPLREVVPAEALAKAGGAPFKVNLRTLILLK